MIKSLFDHDEEEEKPQPEQNKSETESEESIRRQLQEINLAAETPGAAGDDNTQTITQIRQTDPEESFAEAVEDAEDDEIETIILPRIEQVYGNQSEQQQQQQPATVDNVSSDNRFYDEEETVVRPAETAPVSPQAAETLSNENAAEPQPPLLFSTPAKYRNVLQNEMPSPTGENVSQTAENVSLTEAGRPLTTAETIRQSGMAWSAAIGLFGSILFMMILGWFFDLLTGASPFGIVLGIIIGAGIGFYQFFRMTSQIFKK
jgi:F0F1-type ATP synthase assembly protein I